MTDEELYTLFNDSDDPSDGMACYRALYQAGYRAAMRDVNGLFDELDQSGESYKKMWATMGAWLDEQVKKEGA